MFQSLVKAIMYVFSNLAEFHELLTVSKVILIINNNLSVIESKKKAKFT